MRSRSASLFVSLTSILVLPLLGGCPTDHPRKVETDTIEFSEATGSNGQRSQSVSAGPAAPHLPFQLAVNISSDQPLSPDDVRVLVTFRCAFGNTNTFEVDLGSMGRGGDALQGIFIRSANEGSNECVAASGQRELVTWSVQFERPSQTTQQVSFDYELSWAQGSASD